MPCTSGAPRAETRRWKSPNAGPARVLNCQAGSWPSVRTAFTNFIFSSAGSSARRTPAGARQRSRLHRRRISAFQLSAGGVNVEAARLPHEARERAAHDLLERRYTRRVRCPVGNLGAGVQSDQIHLTVQVAEK